MRGLDLLSLFLYMSVIFLGQKHFKIRDLDIIASKARILWSYHFNVQVLYIVVVGLDKYEMWTRHDLSMLPRTYHL